MKKYKFIKCFMAIVFLEAVHAQEQSVVPAAGAETEVPAAGAETEVPAAEAETEVPAGEGEIVVPAGEGEIVVPAGEGETVASTTEGEAEEDSAPSFHNGLSGDNEVPEQPTLRQVLESMKPPSLTDDEYAPGSVWLHSKAGPDMAELTGGQEEQLTSSGQQEPDGILQHQNVIVVEGLDQPGAVAENSTTNSTSKLCNCLPLNRTQDQLAVKLVNASILNDALLPDASVRSRSQPAVCLLVLFYGSTCPFCAAAAPHVNAVPRAFPDLQVLAVDVLENGSLNTRFGIIAVPTVLLFHNGRPQARFNQSEPTLQQLADFVSAHTQLTAAVPLNVTSADFCGPLPAAAENRLDWYLLAAWLFIVGCAVYAATRLRLWRRAAENVRNWWIEAEQHLHEE